MRKLLYNKVIAPGKFGLSTGGHISYGSLNPNQRVGKGGTLIANIQMLRWWWRYLRLALDIEEQGIKLGGDSLEVDRDYYREWDLDEICHQTFDRWFDDHRDLFMEPVVRQDTPRNLDQYISLQIPKHASLNHILRDVRKLIEPHLQKIDHRHSLSGRKVPLLRIHMRYNILVMKMNGESRGSIQSWVNENYKQIPEAIQRGRLKVFVPNERVSGQSQSTRSFLRDKENLDDGEQVISYESGVSRHISQARKSLKDVCRGVFP